jgi:hypothetical protein
MLMRTPSRWARPKRQLPPGFTVWLASVQLRFSDSIAAEEVILPE